MSEHSKPTLTPTLGFIGILAYGLGDILGAGIYALVGKIASVAGPYTWLSFLITLVIAGFTALSYAELSSRIPKSGGEATYFLEAYKRKRPAFLIGWLVLCSGIVSCAAVSVAFSGYLMASLPALNPVWRPVFIFLFISIVGGVAISGMKQSSVANIICTCVEISGLVFLLIVGLAYIARGDADTVPVEAVTTPIPFAAILQGSALAFFAFIGFEDMVNVAEETHSPRRHVPLAILTALGVAGVFYVAVAWVATTVVTLEGLAESEGPLLEVIRIAAPNFPLPIFSIIALFAVANTGMLNLVMGSRLLYGMSTSGLVPAEIGVIHPRTHTPHRAIILLCCLVAVLALSGSLTVLAGTTNILLLLVFVSVHLSLIRIKRDTKRGRFQEEEDQIFPVPRFVPWIGAALCLMLGTLLPARSILTAASVIIIGIVLTTINHHYGVEYTEGE